QIALHEEHGPPDDARVVPEEEAADGGDERDAEQSPVPQRLSDEAVAAGRRARARSQDRPPIDERFHELERRTTRMRYAVHPFRALTSVQTRASMMRRRGEDRQGKRVPAASGAQLL